MFCFLCKNIVTKHTWNKKSQQDMEAQTQFDTICSIYMHL